MDTTRIPPAGDPFTLKLAEFTAKCAGRRKMSPYHEIAAVYEGMHDNLGVEVFAEGKSKSEKD